MRSSRRRYRDGPNRKCLIVRSTKVNAAADRSPRALRSKLIIRAGAGYNTIDVDAASRKSVYVANCPGKNAVAVAELAMGLIMSIDRRIPENVADLKRGVWNKAEYSKADGIAGKKLGIIGTGRIGQEVITRAKAFGMTVYAWSRSLTPEGRPGRWASSFCKTPLGVRRRRSISSASTWRMTPDTKEMIDTEFFDGAAARCVVHQYLSSGGRRRGGARPRRSIRGVSRRGWTYSTTSPAARAASS